MRRSAVLVLGAAVVVSTLVSSGSDVAGAGFAPGTTRRVSVDSSGAPHNGTTLVSGVLSSGGRYLVFTSTATNLVPPAAGPHVYRHDRHNGVTDLVSVTPSGTPSVGGGLQPSVSADGRYVAFVSFATDIVPGDTNLSGDVFVRDMQTGTTALASSTSTGAFANAGGILTGLSGARVLSDDGQFVVFTSLSTNLVAATNNGKSQIYVKDLLSGAVVRASVDASGNAGDDNSSVPTISGNGRVVAFRSESSNFATDANSHTSQVFVRDLDAGTTTLASVNSDEVAFPMSPSTAPSLSRDGGRVAFESQARLDPRDLDNGTWDIYLRDRAAGTTVIASRSGNTFLGVDSRTPSLSADGRFVGFHSVDPGLVPGDANGALDAFLFDSADESLTLVSLSDDEQQATAPSTSASVSSDGRLVLFVSLATNLVTDPPSTGIQAYVRDLAANAAPVVALGDDVVRQEGDLLHVAGSFTDADGSTAWTATVDWGDGSGVQPLALNADKTFFLQHLYPVGTYLVTVQVTDDAGATGTDDLRFTVLNLAPFVNLSGEVELAFDPTLHRTAYFSDAALTAGLAETYTATVDYGDGSGAQPLALDGTAFTLDHTYTAAGTYTVEVRVTDSNGGTGVGRLSVLVRMYHYAWLAPSEDDHELFGRLLPVRFTVERADGTFVLDKSVRVDVLDASGNVVVSPYLFGDQPSKAVVDNGHEYYVNVDTRALAGGAHTLRVSFSSPDLNGEFSRDGSLATAGSRR